MLLKHTENFLQIFRFMLVANGSDFSISPFFFVFFSVCCPVPYVPFGLGGGRCVSDYCISFETGVSLACAI